ncbi:hypothetical protein Tco_0943540 [Tanacetum coccineum]
MTDFEKVLLCKLQFLDSIDDGMKKIIKKEVRKEVSKIIPKVEKLVTDQLESEVLVRSSKEANTSHAVAANLSELELKRILIDKMEANNSINRSDIQKQLYKALVEAYEADQILLDTYGDTVTIKRPRDGADDDEEPSAGTDRGSKRRSQELRLTQNLLANPTPEGDAMPLTMSVKSGRPGVRNQVGSKLNKPKKSRKYSTVSNGKTKLPDLRTHQHGRRLSANLNVESNLVNTDRSALMGNPVDIGKEERIATTSSMIATSGIKKKLGTYDDASLHVPKKATFTDKDPRIEDMLLLLVEWKQYNLALKERIAFNSNDPPLSRVNTLRSGEDRLKLKELMDLCTKLSDRVLDLETTKTAQAKEIASLKKRVNKLERKRKSKTPGMNLFKIGFDADMDEVFKDVELDAEQVISVVADEVSTGTEVNTAGTEVNNASAPVTTAGVSVSTTEPVTTASVNITTTEPITPPTTTNIFEDEDLTIAQTLVNMRSEKSKVRGVVMQEPSKTATRPTVPPQQHDPKDKGKDYELAARIQEQEQEELTIEEKSKRFVDLMDKRKKHFARLRAEEKRRKPLTKAQKRNQMYSFVPVDSEVVKGSKDRAEGSSKRVREDLQQESTKKQKIDDDKEKK